MQLGKEKIVRFYRNFFNLRLGWLAIPIIGGMVFFLNLSHGFVEALRAGVVAGLTGTLITGIMCRVIQHFALWKNRIWSYIFGSGVPTSVTLIMHLSGQSLNHTPELFWSVIAPTLLTFVSSIILNFGTYFFSHRAVPATRLARLCYYFFTIPGRRP